MRCPAVELLGARCSRCVPLGRRGIGSGHAGWRRIRGLVPLETNCCPRSTETCSVRDLPLAACEDHKPCAGRTGIRQMRFGSVPGLAPFESQSRRSDPKQIRGDSLPSSRSAPDRAQSVGFGRVPASVAKDSCPTSVLNTNEASPGRMSASSDRLTEPLPKHRSSSWLVYPPRT